MQARARRETGNQFVSVGTLGKLPERNREMGKAMIKELTLGAALVAAAALFTPATAAPPVPQTGAATPAATEGQVQQVHWRHRHRWRHHYWDYYPRYRYYPRYYNYYDTYGYYPDYSWRHRHYRRHWRHNYRW